jgi:hypothetical protein
MSSDQIAAISAGIREAQADAEFCATFEVIGKAGKWVQFQAGTVNAAYPRSEHPSDLLLGLGGALVEWNAGQFLTVTLATDDARLIATWIDVYVETVLDAGHDYAVGLSIERL